MTIPEEIAHFNALSVVFNGFIILPEQSDGVISLICQEIHSANSEKNWVPVYLFDILKNGEKVGGINLRIGYNEMLYYGGNIGYRVDEAHRGNGYAVRACRLLVAAAKAHSMTKLFITNEYRNAASMRVCEKLGARLLRTAPVPEWHDLYKKGDRFLNIYEWNIN